MKNLTTTDLLIKNVERSRYKQKCDHGSWSIKKICRRTEVETESIKNADILIISIFTVSAVAVVIKNSDEKYNSLMSLHQPVTTNFQKR